MPAVETPPADRMMHATEVARTLGVTRLTLYRWVERGVLPRPIQPMGEKGRRFWPASAVNEFMRGERPAT